MLPRTARAAQTARPGLVRATRGYAVALARRTGEDEDGEGGSMPMHGQQTGRGASVAYRQAIKDKIARHDAAHPPSFTHPILFPLDGGHVSASSLSDGVSPANDLQARLAAHRAGPRSDAHPLVDRYKRRHSYLRISLTERCNLRCTYCMPAEGVPLSPSSHILTDPEILHLARLFVAQGVNKIRLTGGEPTLRRGLVELVRELGAMKAHGLEKVCMTSNGLVLHRRLEELVHAGLTHLNLSLDTLDPAKFEQITRRKGHHAVLASLDRALGLLRPGTDAHGPGLHSVKLNVVLTRDVNLDEMVDFVRLTRDRALSVRFIEFMPFSGNEWDKRKMVPYHEALEILRGEFGAGLRHLPEEDGDGTSKRWKIDGWKGEIGFISSMSDHFCGTCNRLRITADGNLKVCLFDNAEVSLRDILRAPAPPATPDADRDGLLLDVISLAVGNKAAKHAGMDLLKGMQNRSMVMIGTDERQAKHHAARRTVPLHLLGSQAGAQAAQPGGMRAYSTARKPRAGPDGLDESARAGTAPSSMPDAAAAEAPRSASGLTHLDATGRASMVSVSAKASTFRQATAVGRIWLPAEVFQILQTTHGKRSADTQPGRYLSKGDVLGTARIAGIMAGKRTGELIPLCHPIGLEDLQVGFRLEASHEQEQAAEAGASAGAGWCAVRAVASCTGKTGVEMEALTAVSTALLTVWDMTKALGGQTMRIEGICVVRKTGGKSGDWAREDVDHVVEYDL